MSDLTSDPLEDPRTHVTQHAFLVNGRLIGTPLGGPWRRAVALGLDGIVVVILADAAGFFLAIALVVVMLRATVRPNEAQPGPRRSGRFLTRAVTAVVVFTVVTSIYGRVQGLFEDDGDSPVETEVNGVSFSGIGAVNLSADMVGLVRADDEEEALDRARGVVDAFRDAGVDDEEILETLESLGDQPDRPWISDAVATVAADVMVDLARDSVDAISETRTSDEALAAWADAYQRADSAEMGRIAASLPPVVAVDTIAELNQDLDRALTRADRLEENLEEERGRRRGFVAAIRSMADDLGLGFGWSGLYFMAFTVLWRGQTPGKRLLGLRVVRLDGHPIGWFNALERFAGYAAGLATGLLGFAQIFWDRNRQAIQDKIAVTVVIDERAARTAPPSS